MVVAFTVTRDRSVLAYQVYKKTFVEVTAVLMAQIIDPLPSSSAATCLCCYVNITNQIQIARITNIANWYFERVVFPGQRLLFEALPEAHLEIHTGMMASSILSDTIPCVRLRLTEEISPLTVEAEQAIEQKNEGRTAAVLPQRV
jgi:Domain of unknown function (DUF1830)